MLMQVARVGALTGVSYVVGTAFRTVGGTLGTIKKTALFAKDTTMRKIELADKKSASILQRELMKLKADNRDSLIKYGTRTAAQKELWNDLDPKIQDDLIAWEARLPNI